MKDVIINMRQNSNDHLNRVSVLNLFRNRKISTCLPMKRKSNTQKPSLFGNISSNIPQMRKPQKSLFSLKKRVNTEKHSRISKAAQITKSRHANSLIKPGKVARRKFNSIDKSNQRKKKYNPQFPSLNRLSHKIKAKEENFYLANIQSPLKMRRNGTVSVKNMNLDEQFLRKLTKEPSIQSLDFLSRFSSLPEMNLDRHEIQASNEIFEFLVNHFSLRNMDSLDGFKDLDQYRSKIDIENQKLFEDFGCLEDQMEALNFDQRVPQEEIAEVLFQEDIATYLEHQKETKSGANYFSTSRGDQPGRKVAQNSHQQYRLEGLDLNTQISPPNKGAHMIKEAPWRNDLGMLKVNVEQSDKYNVLYNEGLNLTELSSLKWSKEILAKHEKEMLNVKRKNDKLDKFFDGLFTRFIGEGLDQNQSKSSFQQYDMFHKNFPFEEQMEDHRMAGAQQLTSIQSETRF